MTPETWLEQPRPTMGAAYADYDRDEWMDFIVTEWNEGFTLYRNQGADGAGHHWLTVRLIGGQGVNRDAIGARVTVATEGGPVQMQEIKSGSSLGAGNDLSLHFGLGTAAPANVTIVWPGGSVEAHPAVAADQVWLVAR